jgi:molybdopterin synthase sulfur carrier subunit
MVTVVLQPAFAARWTGGATKLEVDAADFPTLVDELDERYPGLADALDARVAVAIDGEIYPAPMLQPINPNSEVFFLPLIEAG